MKDIKALGKIIAKIDEVYESTHHMHKQKLDRLMRRAIKKAEELEEAFRKKNPLKSTKELEMLVDNQINLMSALRRERVGRKIQGKKHDNCSENGAQRT